MLHSTAHDVLPLRLGHSLSVNSYCVNLVDKSATRRHPVHMTTDGGSLRAAREHLGWSQGRAAAELATLAIRRGLDVASPASLKTQLSRWENQHVVPEHTYRALLGELYGRTDAELGLAFERPAGEVSEIDQLRSHLALAEAADDRAVELLEAQLSATAALDEKLGSAAVADSLQAQLSHLERVLTHAIAPSVRERLAGLVGSASMLAGRVAADRSLPASAWRHFERAKLVSHDAGDVFLICWALVEQAQLLVEIGRPPGAVGLLDLARQRMPANANPLLDAWLFAHLGTAHAAAGSTEQARSAYRSAEHQLAETPVSTSRQVDTGRPAGVTVEFGQAAFHRHRGHGLHTLQDERRAIVDLERGLAAGGGSARDVAAVHVDLAQAFSATGDPTSAEAHARTARELTSRIGSARLSARLDAGHPHGQPTSRS